MALALGACGADAPKLPPLPADAPIVAFGDSLTSGVGATPGNDYPAQLQRRVGRTVINAGVSGETTAGGRARLPSVLDEHRPALVILCLGGNDLLRKHDRAQTRANLAAMIDEIRGRGIALVMLAVPAPTVFLLEAEPMYAELARQYRVPLEEEVLADVLGDRSLKADQIHANDRGYARVAEAVEKLLRKSGAI